MTTQDQSERRRHHRAPLGISAVVFTRRGAPLACTVENLSAGGALLRAPLPLEANGPIRVRLRLTARRDVSVNACVVRKHPLCDGEHRFAIAFTDLPPAVEDMVQSAALRVLKCAPPCLNVLVVDDELTVRVSLARELRALGARAREASCAFDAVVNLQEVKPAVDVAIVDAHLDRDDGIEVLRHIAAEHPEVHRVLMSGQVGRAELMRVRAAGIAHQVIIKPWRPEDLQRALSLGS